MTTTEQVLLGPKLSLEQFMEVVRGHAPVAFSEDYKARVNRARSIVEAWVAKDRVMYGVTTGFGALSTKTISREETAKLQENIILSHSVSVGSPLSEEAVRGTLLMMLQNLGQGYSGVRLSVLEQLRQFLNKNLVPWAPGDGSVGYLSPEAHMALVLTGRGKAYYDGVLLEGKAALAKAGLTPLTLASKEGLALVSGTTSPTAMSAIGLYDLLQAAKTADVIGAMSVEILQGVMNAFDARVMAVRPHPEQKKTAENIRNLLEDSQVIAAAKGSHVQDALSLRCIPQLHGAVKKTLDDARKTIEIEMNSCCDNPIIWTENGREDVISGCNADSSYVGLAMDSCCLGAAMLGKMSERRNNRLIDSSLSGYPWFLIQNPGLNSGVMIPQYTQAGLLNQMRILCTSAVIDNTPTCGNQEDYVAMGYNAAKKSLAVAEKLEYILAIELLSVYEAQPFVNAKWQRSSASRKVLTEIGRKIPEMKEDMFLYPYIEYLKNKIHDGSITSWAETGMGKKLL